MNRRDFVAVAISQIAAPAPPDPYKLTIEYELLVPGSYNANPLRPGSLPRAVPKVIAFTAHRRDSVLALTQHLLPVEFSLLYGNSFVTFLAFSNLGYNPGWNYFVNGALPRRTANQMTANLGDRIEWRLGRRYPGT